MKKARILFLFCLIVLICLQSNSQNFQWVRSAGKGRVSGGWRSQGVGVTQDRRGYIYCSSAMDSITDFDVGTGTYTLAPGQGISPFILKVDSLGQYVWAAVFEGDAYFYNRIYQMYFDNQNNLYVCGTFSQTIDFDPGISSYNLSSTGNTDGFVAKIDTAGNLVWAGKTGGAQYDELYTIQGDDNNNIFLSGVFTGTADLDPGPGTYTAAANGGIESFVIKIDVNGNLIWARHYGGKGEAPPTQMALTKDKGILLSGSSMGSTTTVNLSPGPGTFTIAGSSGPRPYLMKLDSLGNFVWAKTLFGAGSYIYGLSVDQHDNIFYTGEFWGTFDLDPGPAVSTYSAAVDDLYLTKLDSAGNTAWIRIITGKYSQSFSSLSCDNLGSVYVGGRSVYGDVVFDPAVANFTISAPIGTGFVCKFSSGGVFDWALPLYGADVGDLKADTRGNVYTGGYVMAGITDFDPGPGTYPLSRSSGHTYIHKLGVDCCVSIDEITRSDRQVSVYPNPTTGKFSLDASRAKIQNMQVYNSLGEAVTSWSAEEGEQSLEVDLSGLAPGIYFLLLNHDHTKKVVLEK